MADLDLLVRPADRDAARRALETLGYRRRPDRTRRPTHDTFELPGNDRLIAPEGEHPDNPRPIELHVEVKRHLWGWVDDDDLTAFLWAGAREGTVAGEPALVPDRRGLLAHLAIHATSDLLLERGRLIQWLDLVEVAGEPDVGPDRRPDGGPDRRLGAGPSGWDALAELPHPRLVHPAMRLAARRLPGRTGATAETGLVALEQSIPERLVRWAATVPLDRRAGLQAARLGPADQSSLEARWRRWAPYPWRLAVAHGSVRPLAAAARHLARVVSAGWRRPGDGQEP